MELKRLIQRLGGPARVGKACGVTPSAVSNWASREEIPRAQELVVWMLAVDHGVEWMPEGVGPFRLVKEGPRTGGKLTTA